ncbi:MAG: hypothetical protein ACI4Q7_04995 [Candidatus Avelusimicrobium sp.]
MYAFDARTGKTAPQRKRKRQGRYRQADGPQPRPCG